MSETAESLASRHLLHGILRRWARSSQANTLVLRGGLMTQHWIGAERRFTRDIDFLGLYPRDLDESLTRVAALLSPDVDDGITVAVDTLGGEAIWQERAFPGHRLRVEVNGVPVQIDIGFGDPLVPSAEWIDYPCLDGSCAHILAVRPELLAAWKLDGLFDHGPKRWLAKDLHDLHLLTTHCHLDEVTLAEAVKVAFETHGSALSLLGEVVYNPAWWQADASRKKWAKFRAQARVDVSEDVATVAETVARALRSALSRIVELPGDPS